MTPYMLFYANKMTKPIYLNFKSNSLMVDESPANALYS